MKEIINEYHKQIAKLNKTKKDILISLGLERIVTVVSDIEIIDIIWRVQSMLEKHLDTQVILYKDNNNPVVTTMYYLGRYEDYHIFLIWLTRKLILLPNDKKRYNIYKKEDIKKLMGVKKVINNENN